MIEFRVMEKIYSISDRLKILFKGSCCNSCEIPWKIADIDIHLPQELLQ